MKPCFRSVLPAATAAMALLAGHRAARAEADLIKTYSPIVQPGILEFETRGHGSVNRPPGNDDAEANLFEVAYGVTDWWYAAVIGATQELPDTSLQFNAVGTENIFQLTPQGKYFLNAGLYLEYTKGISQGRPDEVEAKLLLEKPVPPFDFLLNIAADKEIGQNADSGVAFGYSAEAIAPVFRNPYGNLYLGVQAFGEAGQIGNFFPLQEQNHNLGPVLGGQVKIGNVPGVLEYEVGYLFGPTRASAGGTPKFILEYEIPL